MRRPGESEGGEIDPAIVPRDGLPLLRGAAVALPDSEARYRRLMTRMAALVFELARPMRWSNTAALVRKVREVLDAAGP